MAYHVCWNDSHAVASWTASDKSLGNVNANTNKSYYKLYLKIFSSYFLPLWSGLDEFKQIVQDGFGFNNGFFL